MTIQESLNLAMELERSGRLAEADKLCADILDHQPNVSAAWHLRAMIAARAGRNDIALDMIQRAIAIDPNAAELHANCGEFNPFGASSGLLSTNDDRLCS